MDRTAPTSLPFAAAGFRPGYGNRTVHGLMRQLWQRLLDADARNRAARHLREMPPEHLADIGLSRAMADRAYERSGFGWALLARSGASL